LSCYKTLSFTPISISTSAPPLTVDNVMTAVQGEDWRRLGEAFLPWVLTRSEPTDEFMHDAPFDKSYPKLDEIGRQYESDDVRLHTVVKTWMQGGGVDEEPSWRCFIWRLDDNGIAGVADTIRHFAEPVIGTCCFSICVSARILE